MYRIFRKDFGSIYQPCHLLYANNIISKSTILLTKYLHLGWAVDVGASAAAGGTTDVGTAVHVLHLVDDEVT